MQEYTVGDAIADAGRRSGRSARGTILAIDEGGGSLRLTVRWEDGHTSVLYRPREGEPVRCVVAPAASARRQRSGLAAPRLAARPGDRIVVAAHVQGAAGRDGEILEVRGPGEGPPFRVRWSEDGSETLLYPGADARVEHLHAARSR